MVIDIDFFKQVNDTYGHESGDQVLQQFADMLRFVCRESDIMGRLGGEEFAILLPETPLVAGEAVASRIAEHCRSLVVSTSGGPITCSCSIGISEVMQEDGDIETVLRRADVALYDAKRNGRDGWRCYNPVDLRHDESQMSFHLV
jgi:diguanylate cyclase (GGDEF)-like protein